MKLLFDPLPPTLAPTADGGFFPVRRVFCVGANYAAHAREMGRDPDREPPFFFTKWAETVVFDKAIIPYPYQTENFHYEAELVVAIGAAGQSIRETDAHALIYGYAAGLDMTRRDLQQAARTQGRPWDTAKNVACSAPLGLIHAAGALGDLASGEIRLTVNGEVKQHSDFGWMIWSVPAIIAYISSYYRLEPGDLIYTGTPAGVGPVMPGDKLVVSITGLTDLRVAIGPAI